MIMAENDDDSMFVGREPVINYVLACMTLLQDDASQICIKACRMALNRTIEIADILRNRFLPSIKVKDIGLPLEINTVELVLVK